MTTKNWVQAWLKEVEGDGGAMNGGGESDGGGMFGGGETGEIFGEGV